MTHGGASPWVSAWLSVSDVMVIACWDDPYNSMFPRSPVSPRVHMDVHLRKRNTNARSIEREMIESEEGLNRELPDLA